MRVWLITAGEPLPTDGQNPRLLRSAMLADHLADNGHAVTFFTSAFDHSRKVFRAAETSRLRIRENYAVILLAAPGYQKNISVARVRHERQVAREFRRWASAQDCDELPDVIVASLPTVDLARVATRFGQTRSIPVVVDLRDMWPDVLSFMLPSWTRPAIGILTAPMARNARKACSDATALISHTDEFLDWGLARARRARTEWDAVFPFGYVEREVESEERSKARAFWDGLGVGEGEKVVCYAGSISHQLDPDPVFVAANRLGDLGYHFVFCGEGDRLAELRKRAEGFDNVTFAGWVDQAALQELMRRSVVGLLCVRANPDYLASVPNKVAEYLAWRLPIAAPFGRGPVVRLITEHRCGILYRNDGLLLAAELQRLCQPGGGLEQARGAARLVYEENFRAEDIYARVLVYLDDVCATR